MKNKCELIRIKAKASILLLKTRLEDIVLKMIIYIIVVTTKYLALTECLINVGRNMLKIGYHELKLFILKIRDNIKIKKDDHSSNCR